MPRAYGLRRRKRREDREATNIAGTNLGCGYGIPSFDVANSTICTIVRGIELSRPELAFIIATRAILAAGIALLLADRLNAGQRKAVGSTLALVGLVTTIPAAWAVFGSTSKSVEG
jgi:hypothetical protein